MRYDLHEAIQDFKRHFAMITCHLIDLIRGQYLEAGHPEAVLNEVSQPSSEDGEAVGKEKEDSENRWRFNESMARLGESWSFMEGKKYKMPCTLDSIWVIGDLPFGPGSHVGPEELVKMAIADQITASTSKTVLERHQLQLMESFNTRVEQVNEFLEQFRVSSEKIPPTNRTKPLGLAEAAVLIGKDDVTPKKAGEWLKRSIDLDVYKAEQISRESYVFDIDDFPAPVHVHCLPKVATRQKTAERQDLPDIETPDT